MLPGAVVGKNADVAPGSGVIGKVKNGQYWKGSPAAKSGKARHPWPQERPGRAPVWVAFYSVTSMLLGALPLPQVRSLLKRVDMFMLPSMWENCPYSCLEAMAARPERTGEMVRDWHHDGISMCGLTPR